MVRLPSVVDHLREEKIVVKEPNAPQAALVGPHHPWHGGPRRDDAAMWQAPNMIFLAGVYGAIGSLTLMASAAGH